MKGPIHERHREPYRSAAGGFAPPQSGKGCNGLLDLRRVRHLHDFCRGVSFLRREKWHRLIYEHGLTISTNLFGTTYYSLVGLHAFHVTAGLLMLSIVLLLGLAGRVGREQSVRVDVLSLYWHFVDAVWVVVFTVVYVLGR